MSEDQKLAMLRHFLAALAYRTQKAVRGAPADFATFEAGNLARTPKEVVRHMTSVLGYALSGPTPEQLLQGPLSDAMTHAGQLAMLRRLHGSPVPPEDFVFADIDPSNVGPDQPPPRKPDKEWPERL